MRPILFILGQVAQCILLMVLALAILTGFVSCQTPAVKAYDRSHTQRFDLSYDADSQTVDLGYTITPYGGYAK